MKKRILALTLLALALFWFGRSFADAMTYLFAVHQVDDYVSHPPIREGYAEKLRKERLVVSVYIENIGNRKTENYEIIFRSLDIYKTIRIEKLLFEFEGERAEVNVGRTFDLYNEFDDHTFVELPPHYFSRIWEDETKQRIDFRKIFKSQMERAEGERFPVQVTIFFSLDGGDVQSATYGFEAYKYKFTRLNPQWIWDW